MKKTKFKYANILFIITILLCLLHSIQAGHYVNFYPINGTFQNYNPIRRLLSGQIPYLDFTDYLGLGHLYLGTVVTLIFGGNYHASLIGFSFLTIGSFAAIAYVIGMAIFKNATKTLAMVNVLLGFLLIQPGLLEKILLPEIYDVLIYALGTGNSARFIRGLIVPVSIIMVIVLIDHLKDIRSTYIGKHYQYLLIDVCIGFIAGFCFLWSNDYGISSWLCLLIMYAYCLLLKRRNVLIALKDIIISIVSSLVGIFLFAEIFTLGHFTIWIRDTFGTGGYQGWYYLAKSYYLYDVDMSFVMVVQAILCMAYLVLLLRKDFTYENVKRYGVLAFANMVSFCAVNEYRLLSGGDSREVALSVLFITVLFELLNIIEQRITINKRYLLNISVVICVAWIISNIKSEIVWQCSDNDGEYVEELGGYMTNLADDIKSGKDFIGDNNIFSAYASAQEVMNDTFQPSGIDYNIHVLGDQQRLDYMDSFRNDDFKYSVTIKEDYTDWQIWNERANWFFYRELYKNWHPVWENTYELYWERNSDGVTNDIECQSDISIVNVDETTMKIIIDTDSSINGIADVYLDYEVRKKDNLHSKLLIRDVLQVKDMADNERTDKAYNYLRNVSKEYVPMKIVDGHGELILTSCPKETTSLNINEVSCEEILTISYDLMD